MGKSPLAAAKSLLASRSSASQAREQRDDHSHQPPLPPPPPPPKSRGSNSVDYPSQTASGQSTARPTGYRSRNTSKEEKFVRRSIDVTSPQYLTSLPFGLESSVNRALEGMTSSSGPADRDAQQMRKRHIRDQLIQLDEVLAERNKGSVSIRPYTSPANIDSVIMVYVKVNEAHLTQRELGSVEELHPSFRDLGQSIFSLGYSGNTYMDMDSEAASHYDAHNPGTVSVWGYNQEYREQQFARNPPVDLAIQGSAEIPVMPIDRIVGRINSMLSYPSWEDHAFLKDCVGTLKPGPSPSDPPGTIYSRLSEIEWICAALNKSYGNRSRFVDFSRARTICVHFLSPGYGIGLHNFLFQILLGAELLIRLRNHQHDPIPPGLVTNETSALLLLSDRFMRNVDVYPDFNATRFGGSPPDSVDYIVSSRVHENQAEGLMCFAESLDWPCLPEAKSYIKDAYQNICSGGWAQSMGIADWLFGLMLPGKAFMHKVMSCLVYASPTIRMLGPSIHDDAGLVVFNKSYWPRRSVMGRVLGSYPNARSVCGWIGPFPAPVGGQFHGWFRVRAPKVALPMPCDEGADPFGLENSSKGADRVLASALDPNEWVSITKDASAPKLNSTCILKGIALIGIPETIEDDGTDDPTVIPEGNPEYRANLNFVIDGHPISYSLNSNPVFVSSPPCIGTHSMHRRQADMAVRSTVGVQHLKDTHPTSHRLLIIDALGKGEELVARAWCSERCVNAVIRRGNQTCISCACFMTLESGIGFNVLILTI